MNDFTILLEKFYTSLQKEIKQNISPGQEIQIHKHYSFTSAAFETYRAETLEIDKICLDTK